MYAKSYFISSRPYNMAFHFWKAFLVILFLLLDNALARGSLLHHAHVPLKKLWKAR